MLVVVDVSANAGSTWTRILTDSFPLNPNDYERVTYTAAPAGSLSVRATATDVRGLTAMATVAVNVLQAAEGPVSITPPSSSIAAGQGITFTASGGITGNYSWGGAANGSGPSQTVMFASAGNFAVTVLDLGNATYLPSSPATAAITVQGPLTTLSVTTPGGGTVSGGGSYPQNAVATAVATANPGNVFASWTGDSMGTSPTLSVLMSGNKSVVGHFTALLVQTIIFTAPVGITTRSPAFPIAVVSTSGLPVSLALNSGPVTLNGNTATPVGTTGQVTITATQPGNGAYLAATPVAISFSIGPPKPGVLLADDSAATKRSDRYTRTTSYMSAQGH